MKYTKEEFEEMVEVLFDNLDTKNWEESFISATGEQSEPNTLFKITVDDKIQQVRDCVFGYVEQLEKRVF